MGKGMCPISCVRPIKIAALPHLHPTMVPKILNLFAFLEQIVSFYYLILIRTILEDAEGESIKATAPV
jgi:hypothetical protein